MNAVPVDLDRYSVAELHTLVGELCAQLVANDDQLLSHKVEIEALKMEIRKLRHLQFGAKSERRERQLEQLELWVEELETIEAQTSFVSATRSAGSRNTGKPRGGLPAHLRREIKMIAPTEQECPACGGTLKPLGEDASEMLERESVRFKVIRIVRPKLACACCDTIVQAPAPTRTIERGIAGPALLAHVLTSKYADSLPLYRQSQIFGRDGVELDRSLLAQWVGAASALLTPVADALREHVLAADVVHADDTPLPVLAPGNGKTKTGRLWTYVRDERPRGGTIAPAVWFEYTPNRKGEHPQRRLEGFNGILQADAYSGFSKLYERGQVLEAACWAHVRRKFVDLEKLHNSTIAAEALERIGALYAIEADIRGQHPDQRRVARQATSAPLLLQMKSWFTQTLQTLSQKSELAKAIRYPLSRWAALIRYCDDGRIEIDNNAAERALRCVALGRKNFMFAGSDAGGERAAAIYSLIGTAKLNGINPEAFLTEVLRRIGDHPITRINELLPWNVQLPQIVTAGSLPWSSTRQQTAALPTD